MIWVLAYLAVGVLASRSMYRGVKRTMEYGSWDTEDEAMTIILVTFGILAWPLVIVMMALYKWVHLGDKDGEGK